MLITMKSYISLSIVLLCLLIIFLAKVEFVPNYILVPILLISSLYFFPTKLLLKKINKIELLSDILIFFSLNVSVLLLYTELKIISLIFVILNFLFLIGCVFVFSERIKDTYRSLILIHFVIIGLVGNVI